MANEKRLIYLEDAMKAVSFEYLEGTSMTEHDVALLLTNRRKLKALPTVDAVEVVHGRWTIKHNPITDPKGYFIRIVCSECNLHTGQKSNYCPNCGAKMDKEDL